MSLTPEMEKIVTDFEQCIPTSPERRALCAKVRRLDAALEAAEAALRKERERAERWISLLKDAVEDASWVSRPHRTIDSQDGYLSELKDSMDALAAALAAEQETQ